MTALFSILYIFFFISLNYTIFKLLKSGFKENKNRFLIASASLLLIMAIHFFFHIEGMFTIGLFRFLLFYSFAMIIIYYMFKLMMNVARFRLAKNPNLKDNKNFIIYEKTVYYLVGYIFPVMITLFQIIVIFNPEIGVDLNKN